MGKLDGKVAIVTGASRGLGRDIAIAMAREGAGVVIAARTEHDGESRIAGSMEDSLRRIAEAGGRAIAVRCDVTNEDDITATVQRTLETFGRIDILVNNAAIVVPGTVAEMQARHWNLAFRVNVTAPFTFARAVIPAIKQQGGGHILNISSGASRGPGAGPYQQTERVSSGSTYGITKAALERMSQGMAYELAQDRISVNTMSPYRGIKTEGTTFALEAAGHRDWSNWRMSGDIFGDAAVTICSQDPAKFTGNILYDELVMLNLAGVPQDEINRRYGGDGSPRPF